jgi:histidyl-tRNA synthetase
MRYERPQRGREREFWQLNLDIFGDDGVSAEAEVITIADSIMKEFGARPEDYVIKINNRKLINFMMAQYLGLDAIQAQFMVKLLDRKNKISQQDFIDQAAEIFGDLAESGLQKVEVLLRATSMADMPAEIRDCSTVTEVQELFTLLERNDVKSLVFDITLMRGLDYYTGMVFEVFDTNPENSRSLFGGGRYDGLVGLFDAEPISAVGFAPGGTTMNDFLETHNLLPTPRSTTDVYVAALGEVTKEASKLARELRETGVNVELDTSDRKLDRQIKMAVKKDIPFMLFIGSQEVESGIYTIRDIAKSEEYKTNFDDTVKVLKENR